MWVSGGARTHFPPYPHWKNGKRTNTSKDAIRVPMTDKIGERKSNFRARIRSAASPTFSYVVSSAADGIID